MLVIIHQPVAFLALILSAQPNNKSPYSQEKSPFIIARRTDLSRLPDIVIARAEPKVMPRNYPMPKHPSSMHRILIIFRSPITLFRDRKGAVSIGCPAAVLRKKTGVPAWAVTP